MNHLQSMCLAGCVLSAVGLWMLLPRGGQGGRAFGAVLTAAGLGFLASCLPGLGDWGGDFVFYLLAGVTVFAAAATVTCYSPVYSAIWFALTLIGTAGLFLFQGAQFLGVATVVVYAGAILVTFLFVLMLAQPKGTASYDRLSWEAPLSAATGAVLVGILTLATLSVLQHPEQAPVPVHPRESLEREILAPQHMAHLGGRLFSQHLVAIEIAGTLLLVALVGCIAIVSQMRHDGSGSAEQNRSVVGSGGSLRKPVVSLNGGSSNGGSSSGGTTSSGAPLKQAVATGPALRGDAHG